MVKTVRLDCRRLAERGEAHAYLAQMLSFPAYYGKNLDALYDCLTGLGACVIVLERASLLAQQEGYGAKIKEVLEEAAAANPNLTLVMREEEEG